MTKSQRDQNEEQRKCQCKHRASQSIHHHRWALRSFFRRIRMKEITGIIEVKQNNKRQLYRLEELTKQIRELENEEFIMPVKLGGDEDAE